MQPYYEDDQVTLHLGDSLEVLRTLPDESVNCCVTSPPYYGLRDYGEDGQYGLEPSPGEYVERMRVLFTEVRRVLAKDGTLWLNLGDSYAVRWSSVRSSGGGRGRRNDERTRSGDNTTGLPEKSLLGIPWRVAFALQDDGWILRNEIIWNKPNAMPESVTDRLASRHEHLFLFVKSRNYGFDLDAIRVPYADSTINHAPRRPFNRKDAAAANFGQPAEGSRHPAALRPGARWPEPRRRLGCQHPAVQRSALRRHALVAS